MACNNGVEMYILMTRLCQHGAPVARRRQEEAHVSTLSIFRSFKMVDFSSYAFSGMGLVYVTVMQYMTGELFTMGPGYDQACELSQSNYLLPLMFSKFPRQLFDDYNEELLHRTIVALRKIIAYLDRDILENPLFDVLAVTSGIESHLSDTDFSKAKPEVRHLVEDLILMGRKTVNVGRPVFEAVNPTYDQLMGKLIERDLWNNWTLPYKKLPPADPDIVYAPLDTAFGGHTDKCLGEILKCIVTDFCWEYMTTPYQTGYMPTHQTYYVMTAQRKCLDVSAPFLIKYNQSSYSAINARACVNVYDHAMALQESGNPELNRDLYCEQIFTCATLGYYEFLTIEGLEQILSWQMSSGCYSHVQPYTYLQMQWGEQKKRVNRVKRNEFLKNDFCLPHYTVVCGAALGQYIRFFVEKPPEFAENFG